MDNHSYAIELRGLSKSYGHQRALDGVSLSVPRGSVFGYVGPNGAGKTTTIKILTGLIHPSAGDATVLGRSVLTDPLTVKATTGYVPESGALFEKFSPSEYLGLVGRLYRLPEDLIEERIASWMRRFGLTAQQRQAMAGLSKGMKQKVCWISALLHEPEVLILDEPLNGLDVEAVALAKDLMVELVSSGRTVFYSSHLMDVVTKVCTQVAVLHLGRVVVSGALDDVVAACGAGSLEEALLALCKEASG